MSIFVDRRKHDAVAVRGNGTVLHQEIGQHPRAFLPSDSPPKARRSTKRRFDWERCSFP
jgi:hypothetical protein